MNITTFHYNGRSYNFLYNIWDPSGMGCINEIVTNNEYQLELFDNMEQKVFIDIGANCGVVSIILAKQNPLSTIYSFEPDPSAFELLKQNVLANQLTNIHIFNYAVSKKGVSELELCKHPEYSGGNTTYSDKSSFSSFFGKNREITTVIIPSISLDDIFNMHNIDIVELLKIDCEGAEYDILYDSHQFKTRKIKNMVGEFHNLSYNSIKTTAEKLLEYSKQYISGLVSIKILTL